MGNKTSKENEAGQVARPTTTQLRGHHRSNQYTRGVKKNNIYSSGSTFLDSQYSGSSLDSPPSSITDRYALKPIQRAKKDLSFKSKTTLSTHSVRNFVSRTTNSSSSEVRLSLKERLERKRAKKVSGIEPSPFFHYYQGEKLLGATSEKTQEYFPKCFVKESPQTQTKTTKKN